MPQNNIPAIDHSALDSARAAAGASAMIFWSAQQSAFKVARQDLESNQKAIEDWRKTNADQLEVQIHSEFTKIDQALEQSTNAAESKPEGAVSETGLLRPELIPNSEMRILSEKLDLKSDITTEEGRSVRKTINRAFALADAQPNRQRDETLKTAVVMSVGADLAYSAGQREEAQRLIRAAGITLDIAIGFVPIASSINDATQIVFGLMTGRDYNGNVMTAADYSLRAAGIVIGLLPAGAASFKFGAVVINRASLVTAKLIRRLPIGKIDEMARAAGIILANPVGGVGKGIAAIIRYRRIFPDSERFQAMMSALKPYNYVLTKAGRGLTKHPEALGFDSPEALRKALRTNAALNEAAEKIVEKMLTEGKRVEDFMRTIGSNVIDYALPNGVGVRIKADSFEFITFVQGVL